MERDVWLDEAGIEEKSVESKIISGSGLSGK